MTPLTIDEARARLATTEARIAAPPLDPPRVHAAVALVLRPVEHDCEMLFIRRAPSEGDPWSGDIAFPGGRIDATDDDARGAAERETLEEVGLDLGHAEYLGRLDDVAGRSEAVLVSCFVYAAAKPPDLVLNHEVADARWLRAELIDDPSRQETREFKYLEHEVDMPALRVFDDDAPLLWGLTYRFVEIFMAIVERPIPPMPWINRI